jgi:hypothetical protein
MKCRRVVWKCDNRNRPSFEAAVRLGFVFEGVHRHHYIYKGRSRDTAWFSILVEEWPENRKRFEEYLADENFAKGIQLKAIARPARSSNICDTVRRNGLKRFGLGVVKKVRWLLLLYF